MILVRQLQTFRDWMFRRDRMQFWIIFWGEMLGQGLFAFMNINIINGLSNANASPGTKIIYTSIFYSMSLFINISYGRDFSGGVYNPAVVFFRLFRRTDRYKLSICLIYWGSEFLGSVLGCLAAFYICDLQHTSIQSVLPFKVQMLNCFCEAMGTFILTFMIQYAIEKKMTFISHNKELYIWLPFLYLIARAYSAKSNGVNPAFGLGYQFGWCLKFNRWDVFPMVYILIFPPFIGAGLAVLVFEYVLRPFFPLKEEQIDMIRSEMQKNNGDLRRATQMVRDNKTNRRVGIREAASTVKLNDLNLKLQDLYDFGGVQGLEDQQQIQSLQSDEQSEGNYFQLARIRIEQIIQRTLQEQQAQSPFFQSQSSR